MQKIIWQAKEFVYILLLSFCEIMISFKIKDKKLIRKK